MPFSGEERATAQDAATSPVVGMILVLAVSVVGIAATLYWGLPAIDEMKANVEVRSIRSQLQEFLGDVQELSAGTAGKTAKHFQPSLMRGSMSVAAGEEKWIVAYDMYGTTSKTYDFFWTVAPGTSGATDNVLAAWNTNATTLSTLLGANDLAKAYLLNGGVEEQIIIKDHRTATGHTCTGASTMANFTHAWAPGTAKYLYLCRNVGGTVSTLNLNQNSVRIDILDNNVVVASAWIIDAGMLEWNLKAGIGIKDMYVTNGALIEGTNGQYVFQTAPPIPPPKNTTSGYRFFGRMVELNGTASFAGQDRFDMILNLYATSALEDIDCDRATLTTCVVDVKLYPLGDLRNVWVSYFTNANNGYSAFHTQSQPSASAWTESFVIARVNNGASFTLIRSVITASG